MKNGNTKNHGAKPCFCNDLSNHKSDFRAQIVESFDIYCLYEKRQQLYFSKMFALEISDFMSDSTTLIMIGH